MDLFLSEYDDSGLHVKMMMQDWDADELMDNLRKAQKKRIKIVLQRH